MRKLLLLLPMLYALPVQAAPFCVQTQTVMTPQCDYSDASECRKRAAELSGICIANPAEFTLTAGIGKYCLVDSNRVSQCIFSDRTSCDQEAVRANGVCIENSTENVPLDPYQSDPNRKY